MDIRGLWLVIALGLASLFTFIDHSEFLFKNEGVYVAFDPFSQNRIWDSNCSRTAMNI